MKKRSILFAAALATLSQLSADQPGVHMAPANTPWTPWMTGPLLAPSGHVVPSRHLNVEPYIYVFGDNGTYDKEWHVHSTDTFYTVNLQIPFQIGLIDRTVDFQIVPQVLYQTFKGQSATRLGDTTAGFDFQLLHDEKNEWGLAMKFGVYENFPTGKYQKLNPKKLTTDDTGAGSFSTSFVLVFSRLFHLTGHHYLSTRLGISDTVSAPVHVRRFNTYGGGRHTAGKVYPGNSWGTVLGLEFTLDHHWVLALDIQQMYSNKTRFKGQAGTTLTGAPASVGGPSSNQFSLAPAIEYNITDALGLIAGSWFTVAGRNTDRFWSGIIAINYYTAFAPTKLHHRRAHGGNKGGFFGKPK